MASSDHDTDVPSDIQPAEPRRSTRKTAPSLKARESELARLLPEFVTKISAYNNTQRRIHGQLKASNDVDDLSQILENLMYKK